MIRRKTTLRSKSGGFGATLHAGSTFNGELLGGSSIAAQAGGIVNGRLLAQTSVTLNSNKVVET